MDKPVKVSLIEATLTGFLGYLVNRYETAKKKLDNLTTKKLDQRVKRVRLNKFI